VNLRHGVLAVALGVAVLASCGGPRVAEQPAAEASKLRAQALVDSGNSAYRAADYSGAAKRYAAAAVVNPDDPAAFYGLGMALSKLGRDDEARVAYAHSRELSRGEVGQDSLPHEVRYRRTTHP
jgi:tetratricopeptide (TPR) repeat protein